MKLPTVSLGIGGVSRHDRGCGTAHWRTKLFGAVRSDKCQGRASATPKLLTALMSAPTSVLFKQEQDNVVVWNAAV